MTTSQVALQRESAAVSHRRPLTRFVSRACAFALLCLSVVLSASSAEAKPKPAPILDELVVDYEVGAVFIPKNTGRYGDSGTRFSAEDTNQRDNLFVTQRMSLEGKRGNHRLIL